MRSKASETFVRDTGPSYIQTENHNCTENYNALIILFMTVLTLRLKKNFNKKCLFSVAGQEGQRCVRLAPARQTAALPVARGVTPPQGGAAGLTPRVRGHPGGEEGVSDQRHAPARHQLHR